MDSKCRRIPRTGSRPLMVTGALTQVGEALGLAHRAARRTRAANTRGEPASDNTGVPAEDAARGGAGSRRGGPGVPEREGTS